MIAQIPTEILSAIPSRWTPWLIGSVCLLPYVTRAWHGWQNAGGWRGVWGAVMNGTNSPKTLTGGQGQAPAEKPNGQS